MGLSEDVRDALSGSTLGDGTVPSPSGGTGPGDGPTTADRLDVVDTCLRMHWHLDRQDWDALGTTFADEVSWPVAADVVAGEGRDGGPRHRVLPRAAVVDALRVLMDGLVTQHLVAGHRATVEGDRATCVAHSINTHLRLDRPNDRLVHANLYEFELRREDRGWRIDGLRVAILWRDGNEAVHANVVEQEQVLDGFEAVGAGSDEEGSS